jgi:hypothetical protein
LGWATIPRLQATNGVELEGAYYVAAFAGLLSAAVTAPLTSIVLAAIQRRRRLSMLAYVGTILAVGAPALAFEALFLSASAMPVFTGIRPMRTSEGVTHVWFAATFLALYTAIGIVTYPISRRGVAPAAIAGMATGAGIVVFVLYRMMYAH